MASGYTANYGLCQWQPEDKFLRKEFNQDNEKIDAAVAAASSQASKALSGLEDQSYNIYNLILQNDYAGKYTGWKKALLFDGFIDKGGTSSMSQTLLLSDGAVALSKTGQSDLSLGYGEQSSSGGAAETRSVITSGNGRLTGIGLELYNGLSWETSVEVKYEVRVNGKTRLTGTADTPVIASYNTGRGDLKFQQSVDVKAGDSVSVWLDLHTAWRYAKDGTGSNLGGILRFTPVSGTSGELVTRSNTIPTGASFRLWVRHKNGTVTAALVAGGQEHSFVQGEDRSTTEPLNGVSCTETEFSLDRETESGGVKLKFTLDLSGGSTMTLFDYGLAVI